ncbi:MAG: zinc ribbon domain-containing protein [Clostridia bacterium]|nr:zinc ribbon domain-containing protein [Clostridia bacterium]
MNCKICGAENPEDAVFCKACGKRLDDTVLCSECSARIPGDSVFCPYCGKTQQPQTETHGIEPDTGKAPAAKVNNKKKIFKTVLKYAAPSAALMTALFALIFVFFTGYVKTGVISTGSSVSGSKTGVDLFFYFGEAYKTLNKGFEELDFTNTEYTDYFASVSYVPAVLGTVIAALMLIAVCTLAILALVQSIRCILGKTQKTGGNFAVGAFFAYLAGTLALYAVDNCNIKAVETISASQTAIVTSGCKLDDATIAGITLCAIFTFIYLVVSVLSRGRELFTANSVAKWVLSAVGLAFIIVVIILCAQPAFSLDSDENVSSEKMNVGALYLVAMLTVLCMDWDTCEAVLNLNEATAYIIISFIMLIVTIVIATRVLAGFSKKITGKTSVKQVVMGSLLVVSAILYLAFTVVAGKEFIEAAEYIAAFHKTQEELGNSYINYPIPISTLVFSAATLAVTVTQFCISRKKHAGQVVEAAN